MVDLCQFSLELLSYFLFLLAEAVRGLVLFLFLDKLHFVNHLAEEFHSCGPAVSETKDAGPNSGYDIAPACLLKEPVHELLDLPMEGLLVGLAVDREQGLHETHEHGDEFPAQIQVVVVEEVEDHDAVLGDGGVREVGKNR